MRDYIHVVDLARGHLAALEHGVYGKALLVNGTEGTSKKSIDVFNLGTGSGVSVLEMIAAASEAGGKKLPYKVAPRRAGDIATCFADPRKAKELLHFSTEKTLQEAVADSWRWQNQNRHEFAPTPIIEREDQALAGTKK